MFCITSRADQKVNRDNSLRDELKGEKKENFWYYRNNKFITVDFIWENKRNMDIKIREYKPRDLNLVFLLVREP